MKTCVKFFNIWLCIFLFSATSGFNIQFHKGDHKSSHLVFESNATSKCNNIPSDLLKEWNFVKTDTCMMVYNDFHCKSLTTGRLKPGESFSRDFLIYSFHVCNNHEGGLQLNLDFTTYFTGLAETPTILESHKDVCECINISKDISGIKYWSINNHGNEFMAYYEDDCTEDSIDATYIVDGHSYESRNIYHLKNDQHMVQSVGPAKNSTYYKNSCLKMGNVSLPLVKLTSEESEKPIRGRNLERDIRQSKIEELLKKHTEEIRELNDKTRNLQQKLDHFKINLDQILEKHKQDFKEFTNKIKKDLEESFAKERGAKS